MKDTQIGRLRRRLARVALVFAFGVSTAAAAAPVVLHVTLKGGCEGPVSGRLLVFAKAVTSADDATVASVDSGQADPRGVAVAAREVSDLRPGETIDVDADVTDFPQAFSTLPAGRYLAQAVLDRRHSYAYDGRGEGDIVGAVARIDLPASGALTLDRALSASDPWSIPADASPDRTAQVAHARAATIAWEMYAVARPGAPPREARPPAP